MIGHHVRVPFATWKRHAVVAGDDDEGVVQQAPLLQSRQHAAEMPVEVLGFKSVIEHVISHRVVVRPVSRHMIDVGQFLAALGHARAELITAMRLNGAIPEAPGLVRWRGFEEVFEVGGIVIVADLRRWRLGFALIESDAGHEARLAIRIIRNTRPPAFHSVTDKPAMFRQSLAPAFEFNRKVADVIGRFLELP